MRSAAFTALVVVGALRLSSAPEPLLFVQSIYLPQVEGRIDHLAFDAATRKLFVAALGNNTIEIVDVNAGAHVRSLPGFREPQGIAVVADPRLVVIANGQGDGVQLVRADDYRDAGTIQLGEDSDNVRYDVSGKRVYVGYGSGAIAALNVVDRKVLGEARLAGHPESFQLERAGTRIFVNVPTARQIAVIDRKGMKVTGTWLVADAQSNFPMALDEAGHRLFVGCRRPARLLVYDITTGKAIASADIVGDTDDLFYDAARNRLYIVGGEGYVDVLQLQEASRCTRIGRVATAAGARTALFVPEEGRLYVAVPRRGAQRAEVRVYEAR